jgi:hypothetical protein
MPILLDLNNEKFQEDLLELEKAEALALLKTLRKLRQLEWNDIYKDQGLKWELANSLQGIDGENIYSIRITQKCRALVQRSEDTIIFLSLHPDHDSAYSR